MFSALRQIGRTHGQLEFIHGTEQNRIDEHILAAVTEVRLPLQLDEDVQLILEDASRPANCLLRVDSAIGLDVDDEFVQIRTLLDAGGLDIVGNPANRAERGVQLETANGSARGRRTPLPGRPADNPGRVPP